MKINGAVRGGSGIGQHFNVDIKSLFSKLQSFFSLTDIRIKGSMRKCIWFWWKEISSDHKLRWIPRIHLVCFARFDSSFRKYHIRKVKIYWSFISHSCENKWKALCSGMLCSMYSFRYHRKLNIYQSFISYSCQNKWKPLFMCSGMLCSMGGMPPFARVIPG